MTNRGKTMAQNKKVTTFYAAEDVSKYLDGLPSGDKSRRINEMLRQAIATEQSRFVIPMNFNQISRLLSILYQQHKDEEANREAADPQDVAEWEPPPFGWVETEELIRVIRGAVD
jgi:hypothetical protein